MILGLRASCLIERFHIQNALEVSDFGGVQIGFGVTDGDLRHVGNAAGDIHCCFQQVGVVRDPVDHARGQSVVRADQVTQKVEFAGLGGANELREGPGATPIAGQADFQKSRAEPRRTPGDAQICGERHAETGAHRDTVHHRDDGFRNFFHHHRDAVRKLNAGRARLEACRGTITHRFYVTTGGEASACTRYNDAANIFVVPMAIQRVQQSGANIHRQRIQPFWPVKSQGDDAVVNGLNQIRHEVLRGFGFPDLGVTSRCLQHWGYITGCQGRTEMDLTLEDRLKIGIQTIHRRTEPATGPWLPKIDELVALVELVDRNGYDSLWVGDHISFPVPIFDPMLQLAQAAVVSRRLILGTSVLLLPLRHPTPVAKQVLTLDHLTEGRFVLGVGVGGEFPKEYAACDVPHHERGARLAEGVQVLKKFFSGEPVSHQGRFYGPFEDVPMRPPPRQPGGPPIWFAGRKDPALRRIGRLGDGYLAYVITPDMYRAALATIAAAAEASGRQPKPFGTGHLLFTRLDTTYETALDRATETLSVRYAMDFRKAAARYCALGTPAQVVERIREFYAAGVRHVVLDLLGPYEERHRQIEWFASEALPLLRDLTAG